MNNLIGLVVGLLARFFGKGDAATVAGTTTANVFTLAMLSPVVVWLLANTEQAALVFTLPPWFAVTFTWGQVAFISAVVAAVVKVAHWTPKPGG